MERINRILISLLTKLSIPKPDEWYKHVEIAQQFLNSSHSRSTGTTPCELMIGRKMKLKDDLEFRTANENELKEDFNQDRAQLREEAAKIWPKSKKKIQHYTIEKRNQLKNMNLEIGLQYEEHKQVPV